MQQRGGLHYHVIAQRNNSAVLLIGHVFQLFWKKDAITGQASRGVSG
jgi:hypothetical protein